jgi:hypothetical protein
VSEPEKNSNGNDKLPEDKDERKESPNIIKILDELLAHTNSSRRLFLIFIASALFFGPAALILGGVLLEHPQYNIRHLETSEGEVNSGPPHIPGTHLQLVDPNGTVIREIPMVGSQHTSPILFGLRIFIVLSIIFAVILLFIAIKEYRFFAHWNNRFTKYKELKDKVDKELGED